MNDSRCGIFQWIPKTKVAEFLTKGWELCEGDEACHHNAWSFLMKAPEEIPIMTKEIRVVRVLEYFGTAEMIAKNLNQRGVRGETDYLNLKIKESFVSGPETEQVLNISSAMDEEIRKELEGNS